MTRWRRVCTAVAIVAAVGVALVVGVGWHASGVVIHPPEDPCPYRPENYPDLPLASVLFKSRDGLDLAGWFVRGRLSSTVILVHGRGGNKCTMLPHAHYLHRAGFSALLFDFRYRGDSEGDAQTLGAKESWDIQSAVDYLMTRPDVDPVRIGVQGNSLGAASAILAAADKPEIKGVIAHMPFTSINHLLCHTFEHEFNVPCFPFGLVTKWLSELRLGVDFDKVAPIDVIDKISPRPIFLIDDGLDTLFPSQSVELLYGAARAPKYFWTVPDAPHGRGWEIAPKAFERKVVNFWKHTLGKIP